MRFTTLLIILSLSLASCKSDRINYKYVGSYNYNIFNDSLHKHNSYLSPNSYGYVIGNLDFQACGIEILDIDSLNKSDEYIISLNHPIKRIETDSDKIRGEEQEHIKKQPLDIILNESITTDSIYIYKLEPKGKYRLLLP